eukprot:103631-Rhodomonas_salina.1
MGSITVSQRQSADSRTVQSMYCFLLRARPGTKLEHELSGGVRGIDPVGDRREAQSRYPEGLVIPKSTICRASSWLWCPWGFRWKSGRPFPVFGVPVLSIFL